MLGQQREHIQRVDSIRQVSAVILATFNRGAAMIHHIPGVLGSEAIDRVLAYMEQADLVDIVARFDPKIVKMCDDGSKPED